MKLKAEYEDYNTNDLSVADDKLKRLRNKLAQYGAGDDEEMIDMLSKHEKLLNSEEGRAFAEFRAKVSALESEIKITKARRDMELEDMRKQ